MRFGLLAIASIAWSLTVLRWSVARKHSPWRKRAIVVSIIAGLAAIVSFEADLRSLWLRYRAPRSNVAIVITDMGQWWQISYRRGMQSFITANEVHVPAGALVVMAWKGPAPVIWRSHDFLAVGSDRFFFVAETAG